MGDDLVTDGILPAGGTVVDDEFDPNAVESDDFLDDPEEVVLEEALDAPLTPPVVADDDDDDLLDE